MREESTSLLKIHISVFLFGFAGLFGKWIQLDAMSIVWGRVFFASIAFGIWFLVNKQNPFKISAKSYFFFLLLGGLLAFHWWSFFMAIQMSNVAIGLFSFSTFPVFTVFLEPLFSQEKWKNQYFILALFSLLGIYLMLPSLEWDNQFVVGIFWGILSGLSFAILTILNRILLTSENNSKKYEALSVTFFQDLFAFLWLSPFVFYHSIDFQVVSMIQLAVLGIIFTALAHFLYVSGLKNINARTASLISNLEPIYGAFLAFLLLNEEINLKMAIGGVLIIFSAFFVSFISKNN